MSLKVTEYTAMLKRSNNPDYELEDVVEVGRPDQFRAFGGATRQRVLGLLHERAATVSQLAEALRQPKGSVAYHVKVLEEAGLVRVVSTRRVRATTERYYGRTARTFKFVDTEGIISAEPFAFLHQAISEYAPPPDGERPALRSVIRHARIPHSRAEEYAGRVAELSEEFAREPASPGERVYGFVSAVYLTDWPELPGAESPDDTERKER